MRDRIVHAVPSEWDNVELSSLVDTSDEMDPGTHRNSKPTSRKTGDGIFLLAAKAAEEALADSGLKAEEIPPDPCSDVFFSKQYFRILPVKCKKQSVQFMHGDTNPNAACSRFILAVPNTGAVSISVRVFLRLALVIGAEKMSRIGRLERPWELVFYSETVQVQWFSGEKKVKAQKQSTRPMAHSAGDKGEALTLQYGTEETPVIRMDGQAVFQVRCEKSTGNYRRNVEKSRCFKRRCGLLCFASGKQKNH